MTINPDSIYYLCHMKVKSTFVITILFTIFLVLVINYLMTNVSYYQMIDGVISNNQLILEKPIKGNIYIDKEEYEIKVLEQNKDYVIYEIVDYEGEDLTAYQSSRTPLYKVIRKEW